MKPDWDRLMDEFAGSKSAGVYDVDCTGDGKDLCDQIGVNGYPTIKYGEASDKAGLQVYEGERDFENLKKFADDNLGPVCRPADLDACSPEDREVLEGFAKTPLDQLKADYKKAAKEHKDKEKKLTKRKNKNMDKAEALKEDRKDYLDVKVKKGKEAEHKKKGEKLKERQTKIDEEESKITKEQDELKATYKKLKLMKMASEVTPPKTEL